MKTPGAWTPFPYSGLRILLPTTVSPRHPMGPISVTRCWYGHQQHPFFPVTSCLPMPYWCARHQILRFIDSNPKLVAQWFTCWTLDKERWAQIPIQHEVHRMIVGQSPFTKSTSQRSWEDNHIHVCNNELNKRTTSQGLGPPILSPVSK